MHLGIFAKTFPRPKLEETLDTIAYHRLTHVQFNMSCAGRLPTLPNRIDENLCRSIARSLRDRGLTMAAISGTFNLCDPDASRLDNNLRRLEVLAAACRWLDTRIITLCTGTLNAGDMWTHHPDNVRRSAWETLLKSMRAAVEIADRHEVTLAFEPEIHNVVSSVMRARKLLDEIDSPWLKVVIDPTNLFSQGEVRPFSELLCEAFEWLGKDIVLAHAKPPHFGEPAAATVWLSEFLGEKYREAYREMCENLSLATRGKELEHVIPSWEELVLQHPFFHRYATELEQLGYAGVVIIHGVEEVAVENLVSSLRKVLKISEGPEPGN
jgi:sugar phosphate isomerase/epimerase